MQWILICQDTNITQTRLNSMFPEIPDFFSKYLEKRSKYLKNIWLHFINITVKKNSLSSKMATQLISANFKTLYSCTAYNKTLNDST